jgi:hypothetical protein
MKGAPRVGAVVFALLVFATIAAFAWSQQRKRDPLVLDRVSFRAVPFANRDDDPVRAFTPNGDCRFDRIRIRFRVTQSDDANVQVVKPGGKLVVTLARDTYLKRYRFFTYHWNGRQRREGADDRTSPGKASAGRYKLRVKLLGQDRTLVPGGVMKLHKAKLDSNVTFCFKEKRPSEKGAR